MQAMQAVQFRRKINGWGMDVLPLSFLSALVHGGHQIPEF